MKIIYPKYKITFNGHQYDTIKYSDSAVAKHPNNGEEILIYIYKTLDGQNRKPDEPNDPNGPVHKVASHCVGTDVPKISTYRDTCFRPLPNENAIHFFHCSPIQEKQFNRRPEKMKIRNGK